VVADGRDVLGASVASQIELHARFGGVVPEIASRAHIEAVNPMIDAALQEAARGPSDIAAVAVAHEPGLIGSLLVGLMAAKTLAWVWDVPLIGVNHIYAHSYAATLNAGEIEYPAVALVASGGHTALYRCGGPLDIELLGSTIDDAAGEAFDKVANILGLGFPGGPAIDKAAKRGDPSAVDFPRSLLHGQSLDFSFSGLKTAVLYHVRGVPGGKPPREDSQSSARSADSLSASEIADIAASFQAAVVDVLRIKIRRAVQQTGAKTIVLGGGVSANSALRATAGELAKKLGCTLRLPEMRFCMDNAAMIAGLGYHYLQAGMTSGLDLAARATVRR
jgi:N6-L-threonylcarbamoyladenine synthase